MKALTLALAAALTALLPAALSAATVQQTLAFSGSTAEFTQPVGGFDYFDEAGTLDAVTLTYDFSAAGSVTVNQCRNTPGCAPATYTLSLTGSGPFAGLSDSASAATGITSTGNGSQTRPYSVNVADSVSLATAGFVGTGTFGGLSFVGDYVGRFGSLVGTFGGTVTLTYEYTLTPPPPPPAPVPLPASVLMLPLPYLALRAMRGRR